MSPRMVGHLHLEGLTAGLPALSLDGQAAQEGCAAVNLGEEEKIEVI